MLNECYKRSHIEFMFPIDGDVLNEFDGRVKCIKENESLEIKVGLIALKGCNIKVNGIPAIAIDNSQENDCYNIHCLDENKILYETFIILDGYRNTVIAEDENTGEINKIVIYWLNNGKGKYRISTDDNIWFLKDITQNSNVYKSIFDNPYLQVFKEVHDKYGSKVHFNLFYQTDGFNLSQMTDKFKSEWQANADWIRLTFHALQEFPDKPYINTTYNYIKRHYELVTNEIIRFAGEELLSPITTVHWGELTIDGARALRTLGIKGLAGYFKFDDLGRPSASYYADNSLINHLNKRDYWKDNLEDIIFVKHDIVLNTVKSEEIVPYLNNIKKNPHESGLIEIMIHEQYFYEYYHNYQPDFKEKVITAARWATENGYKPEFWNEVLLER